MICKRVIDVRHRVFDPAKLRFPVRQDAAYLQRVAEAKRRIQAPLPPERVLPPDTARANPDRRTPQPWTQPETAQLKRMWVDNRDIALIEEALGRPRASIYSKMRRIVVAA